MDSGSKQYLYYLSDQDRALLSGKLGNIEHEKVQKILNNRTKGSCFGMSATSILQAYGFFKASDLVEGVDNIGAITSKNITDDVKSAINYYQMLQFTKPFTQRVHNTERMAEDVKLKMLIDSVKAGKPTLICYNYDMADGTKAGHAVVAYGIRTNTKHILYMSANESKQFDTEILIYDNNYTTPSEIYNLFVNTSTWEWCIQMTEKQEELKDLAIMNLSNHRNGNIALIADDTELLNYHGKFDGNETYQYDENAPYYASMNMRQMATNYKVSVARDPYDGTFNDDGDDGDIRMSANFFGDDDENEIVSSMNCDNCYHIELTNPRPVDISMEYQYCLLGAAAEGAKVVTVSPKARISCEQSTGTYELSMVIDEGYHETDWYKIDVMGSNAGDILLTNYPEGKGWLLKADSLKNVGVAVSNRAVSADAHFSTDYNEVLIYEIDPQTIGIAVDTDSDGTFETEVQKSEASSVMTGDLDGDGEVTATDAQIVLVAYTEALASGKQELTGDSFTAADVDLDGEITAADAQYILIYFVQKNVVGDPKDWDELIQPK